MMKKVISASRRLDMVAGYPDQLAVSLREKCPPETVHTLVVWTKNPANLLRHERLKHEVSRYKQLFIHLSVTGFGNTPLEPNVPPPEDVFNQLPEIVALVGDARRIRFRFDPIIHVRHKNGPELTNVNLFSSIATPVATAGIRDISTSWMTLYPKVARRLAENSYQAIPISTARQQEEAKQLIKQAQILKLKLHFCSVPGFEKSSCIDGRLLTDLHPDGERCTWAKAAGQREFCGCTRSWDIGWYYACPHGCLYCYANPAKLQNH